VVPPLYALRQPYRKRTVDRWLDRYFAEPWGHELHLLPLVAARGRGWSAEDLRPTSRAIDHLYWALRQWSAFRKGKFKKITTMETHLRSEVRSFIREIRGLAVGGLCRVPPDEIDDFARNVARRCRAFGRLVKGNRSCVLPSKAAHLMLPDLVPAYDDAVIKNEVLTKLITGRRDSDPFELYVRLCWGVLQDLGTLGLLERARRRVAKHLVERWSIRALGAMRPTRRQLASMDSTVAEYLLTGMAWSTKGAALSPILFRC
jgi:hypothetical protein